MNEDKTEKEINRILKNITTINKRITNNEIDEDIITNYFVDIYENRHNKHNIIDYDVLMIIMSNYLDGLLSLFGNDNYILYGSFIYDVIFSGNINIAFERNDEKVRKFYIAPKTINDIKRIEKFLIKLDYNCVKENSLFRYYLGRNIIIINKDPIENIIVLFKKISENNEFDDISKCVYITNQKILVHPYCNLNHVHKDNLEILNNINENNDATLITLITRSIIYGSLDIFIDIVENNKITPKLVDILFNVCITLEKYEHLDVLISNEFPIPNSTIYNAIKQNNAKYIEYIMEKNINLNIFNDKGLTPIEYALKRSKNKKLTGNKIIMDLNKFRCIRNPKWYDMIHSIKVYNVTKKNTLEEMICDDIITAKIQTIIELNNCIIRNMLKNNMTQNALEYLKQTYNFVNQNVLIENIKDMHMEIVFYYFGTHIQVTTRLIEILFDMNMYERILLYKNELLQYKNNCDINVDVRAVLKYLISKKNAKGLIFLFTKIDNDLSKIRFENNDTILHVLCAIQNDDNFMDIYKIYKVLVYYYPQSILICNDDGNLPLFVANGNNYLTEMLIIQCLDGIEKYKNNLGDTYLHHIIRFNNINVFNKVIACGILKNNEILNSQNNNNETPLILASKLKLQDICNILIMNRADLNAQDFIGNTIYHYICLYGLSNVCVNTIPEIHNYLNLTPHDYVLKNLYNLKK